MRCCFAQKPKAMVSVGPRCSLQTREPKLGKFSDNVGYLLQSHTANREPDILQRVGEKPKRTVLACQCMKRTTELTDSDCACSFFSHEGFYLIKIF